MSSPEKKYEKYIGHDLGTRKWKIPVDRLIQYQKVTGDTRPEYLKDGLMSPAFTCVLVREAGNKSTREIVDENGEKLIKNPLKILHASQGYEFLKLPKAGTEMTVKSHVSNVYIKRNKLNIETVQECLDEQGNLCIKVKNRIVVRDGGF
ncbi:MAG: hypothetical protein ACTSRW_13025 [Candidatus Helarchaeota archaeon]